ncbi:MAG: flavodoxin family protein [Methanobacteriaceae archaeon]
MIVGICGSPRQKATDYVTKEALKMLEEKGYETTFFSVRGKNIAACIHCDYCIRESKCIKKDDMYEVYSLIQDCEGLVLASPSYNGGMSAQLKAILDRTRALGAADINFLKNKVGIAIAVGGDRMGGQELVIQQIITYYVLNGAIPVSGGAWGANLGATFWSKDSVDGVKADEEGFKTLKKTVNKFIEFLETYSKK